MRTAAVIVVVSVIALPGSRNRVVLAAQVGQDSGDGVQQMDTPRYLRTDPARTPPVIARSEAADIASQSGGAAQPPQPRSAAARPSSGRRDRGYVSLNVAFQATSNGFTGTTTFIENVESGTATTTFGAARPPVLDIGAAARIWRDLAVGASVTWLTKERSGALSANIPHPFLFNAPRTVTGSVSNAPRDEVALHVDGAWLAPTWHRMETVVFGGPSYFRVAQGLVTDVTTSSSYPFDAATFVGATVSRTSKSHIGYNGGVDVTVPVARHAGIGALVRYSHASVSLPAGLGTEVTVRAGGVEVGGGVRLRF
jgi:hypothetical protein